MSDSSHTMSVNGSAGDGIDVEASAPLHFDAHVYAYYRERHRERRERERLELQARDWTTLRADSEDGDDDSDDDGNNDSPERPIPIRPRLKNADDAVFHDNAQLMLAILDRHPHVNVLELCRDYNYDFPRCRPIVTTAARDDKPRVLRVLLDHPGAAAAIRKVNEDKTSNWGTPMTEACRNGNVEAVRVLLEKRDDLGIDIDEVDNFGMTPLLATASGCRFPVSRLDRDRGSAYLLGDESARRVEILGLLVDKGADLGAQQVLTQDIYKSTYWDGVDKEELCRENSQRGGNALVAALRRNINCWGRTCTDVSLVRALVAAGVDVHQVFTGGVARMDGTEIWGGVADRHHNEDDKNDKGPAYEGDFTELTPLAVAAMYNNAEGVETLLGLGVDMTGDLVPSSPSQIPPLHAAVTGRPHLSTWGYETQPYRSIRDEAIRMHDNAMEAAVKTVELLTLTADAAVCAATINRTFTDIHGRAFTPLQIAACFDRLPLLRALLDRGADASVRHPVDGKTVLFHVFASLRVLCPSTSRDTFTPYMATRLHAAAEAVDMHALVGDLLRGLDSNAINEADEDGNTSLHWAMGFRLVTAVEALVAHGANKHLKNNAGEVPVHGTIPTTSQPMRMDCYEMQSEDEHEDVDDWAMLLM